MMSKTRVHARLAACGLAVLTVVAGCAAERPPNAFEDAFNDEDKPWQEIETQIPAPPREPDLVPFQVNGASTYRFDVDAKSLSVGNDGVFRYTLVAISAQGARNVSYEGIRCQTHEKKIYAIGRADGTWARSRSAAWAPIEDVGVNRQHAALDRDYFCPDGYAAESPAEIVKRMSVRAPATEGRSDQTQYQKLQR